MPLDRYRILDVQPLMGDLSRCVVRVNLYDSGIGEEGSLVPNTYTLDASTLVALDAAITASLTPLSLAALESAIGVEREIP